MLLLQLNPSVPLPLSSSFSLYPSVPSSLARVASLFSSLEYSFRVLRSPLLSSSLIRFLPYPLLLFLLLRFFLLFLPFISSSSSSSFSSCRGVSLERCAFARFFSGLLVSPPFFLVSRGTCFCRPRLSVSSPLPRSLSSWLRLCPGV